MANTEHTSRPCKRAGWVGVLPAAALTAGAYLKARVARTKVTFVNPPPDSMGP
jgi:hypothetical protein